MLRSTSLACDRLNPILRPIATTSRHIAIFVVSLEIIAGPVGHFLHFLGWPIF